MLKKIYLSSPHMGGEEIKYINRAFEDNWIAPLGKNVDEFEKDIASYIGVEEVVALNSGTAAIHMALKALGVKNGDIVLCSSLTFSASANPIIYEGAVPIFIDSDYESYNMSSKALKKAIEHCEGINKIPTAIIVVNLYGQSANYDEIREISNKYNIPIIEDAAESLGAIYKGRKSGTLGDLGVFSFNGNKIITTSGGGMLVSSNKDIINKVRFWATQSKENERYYEHKELGYNYRMSNIVAGIGRGQVKVLESRVNRKREIFNRYKGSFEDISYINMEKEMSYGKSNRWLSVMTIDESSKVGPLDIILALEKENIEARHVWKPMHRQPYYKECRFFSHNPESEKSVSDYLFARGVCLPSDTKMTDAEQDRVIEIIRSIFE